MMTKSNLRKRFLEARPDIAARAATNAHKRALALQLKALRRERGLTQKDVERISGLQQSMISRLEAPTGAMPQIATIEKYVEACNGEIKISISLDGHPVDGPELAAG